MHEYIDLIFIFINLLLCGFLLSRQNRIEEKQSKIESLLISNIRNPKLGKRILNSYKTKDK